MSVCDCLLPKVRLLAYRPFLRRGATGASPTRVVPGTAYVVFKLWVFEDIFVLIPFRFMYYPKRSILKYNCFSSNMVLGCIDPLNSSSSQRFSHLAIPTKYQHLTSITILIP